MEPGSSAGRIVVGVDGSPASWRAAAWAAEEALIRDARLDLVLAWRVPAAAHAAPGFAPRPAEDLDTEGRILDEVLSHIRTDGIDISRRICVGPASSVLRGISEEAGVDMVVVGRRDRHGVADLRRGSVAHYLTHHNATPLVIVPAGPGQARATSPARVVVGVDDTSGSETAFIWAVDEARRRGAVLEAVAAWSPLESAWPDGTAPGTPLRDALARSAAELLDRLATVAAGLGVTIEGKSIEGTVASVLVHRSAEADLLVVGARGRATEILLGSVGDQCSRRTAVPIAIVR